MHPNPALKIKPTKGKTDTTPYMFWENHIHKTRLSHMLTLEESLCYMHDSGLIECYYWLYPRETNLRIKYTHIFSDEALRAAISDYKATNIKQWFLSLLEP